MAYIPSRDLVRGALAGEPRAISRLLTRAENATPEARPALDEMFRHAGRAHIVGITGVPGSGKSTLVAKLAALIRASGRRIGIVAIDPSSPFSGGSILGDRIRMGDLAGDPGVYVRSMATRGAMGGLASGTLEAVDVLDAAGFDVVIVETVGVGQDEVDVVRATHTTVVVSAPGLGDDIQAIKAGIMEIADVFAVNKADREGAHALMAELRFMVHLHHASSVSPKDIDWEIPVLATQALTGAGVAELMAEVGRHRGLLEATGALEKRRRERRREELRALLVEALAGRVLERVQGDPDLAPLLQAVGDGRLDVHTGVARIVAATLRRP